MKVKTRTCTRCQHRFPENRENFPVRDGAFRGQCRDCYNKQKRNAEIGRLNDPLYRLRHNKRKSHEKIQFRRANPTLQRERDREAWLKKVYGITVQWYDAKLKEQNKVCALCFEAHSRKHWRSGKIEALHIDHDHANGKVRGLLCTKCNKLLGQFEILLKMCEPVVAIAGTWLEKAAAYLEKHRREHESERTGDASKAGPQRFLLE